MSFDMGLFVKHNFSVLKTLTTGLNDLSAAAGLKAMRLKHRYRYR